jgi:hypothetical protein
MICRRAALLCVALLLPATARAKMQLQGQVTASAGWTDNILSSPTPIADFLFELKPSLIFTAGVPRFVSRLAYIFTADLFATHSSANSYNHRVDWSAFATTSKSTDILLHLAFSEGRLNTLTLGTGSALTTVTPLSNTTQEFAGLQANEAFTWDITSTWRFFQTIALNSYWPLNPRITPDTYDLDQHLISERAWRHDAVALDLKVDFALFTQLNGNVPDVTGRAVPGIVSPEQDVLVDALTIRWKHDYGHFWNTQIDIGVVESNLAHNTKSIIWQPAAFAAVRYLHPYGTAELTYTHLIAPNAIVASVFITDSAILRAALPLGHYEKTHLSFAASGGYQYAQGLDEVSGNTISHTHIALADATLSWMPRIEFSIYARYQFMDQIGNASGDDLLPLPSFHKHTVMLGLTGTWPGEPAAVVPTRQALRVDRGDAITIPEPHSEPKY